MTPIERLIRAALQIRAELNIVDVEGGLSTLAEFSDALNALPEAKAIAAEMKTSFERRLRDIIDPDNAANAAEGSDQPASEAEAEAEAETTVWLQDGNLVYRLVEDGFHRGKPVMRNAMSVRVQHEKGATADDAANVAKRIQAFLNSNPA